MNKTLKGINPKILKWAREQAGLSLEDAARAIGLSDSPRTKGFEKLSALEAGEKLPTRRQLQNIASTYKRATFTFYLSHPPRKPNIADKIREFSVLAGKELLKYVSTRDKIIAQFETLDLNKEEDADLLRNHFLKRGITGDSFIPVPIEENYLWLLDDKFITYSYVASEKKLKRMLSEVGLIKPKTSDRFDVAIYADAATRKRAVLIDFKKSSANYKENGQGINQLSNYADILSKNGIDELYIYLIANIDAQFKVNLINLYKFTKVFSQDGDIYRGTLDNVNAYIQIVSPKTLVYDALTRNRSFIIDMILWTDLEELNND